ncbi:MAG: DUF3604 domain-containing protein [Myxococcota bacterium]|nr:DUF3604 domain-containing protein [Myxococcota bacterium]
MARWIAVAVGAVVLFVAAYVGAAWFGIYGQHEGPGEPTATRIPEAVVAERAHAAARAAAALTPAPPEKQILFGDLHVHTTFSTDAFLASLPMLQGEGAHPIADACDFARFCSALDFWSINDHAEASTPRRWQETKESIRQCNALAGDPDNPDVVAFLGYEWSQVGRTPDDHYGHKNVVIRGLADDEVPVRPIGAGGLATDALRNAGEAIPRLLPFADFANRQRYWNFIRFLDEIAEVPRCPEGVPSSELPADCYEAAGTPEDLFRKLDEAGHDSIVIPHGNTWGFYSPPGITWDKQLAGAMHDPSRQTLIEVMSGHGNSEEYRDWRAVEFDAAGIPVARRPATTTCRAAGARVRSFARVARRQARARRSARSGRPPRGSTMRRPASPAGTRCPARLRRHGSTRVSVGTASCRRSTTGPAVPPSTRWRSRTSKVPRNPMVIRGVSSSGSSRRATITARGPGPGTRSSRATA